MHWIHFYIWIWAMRCHTLHGHAKQCSYYLFSLSLDDKEPKVSLHLTSRGYCFWSLQQALILCWKMPSCGDVSLCIQHLISHMMTIFIVPLWCQTWWYMCCFSLWSSIACQKLWKSYSNGLLQANLVWSSFHSPSYVGNLFMSCVIALSGLKSLDCYW
jgi:hypothetical protein